MGAATTPLPPREKTWGDVFKDPALLITLWVTGQFFILILVFSQWPSKMADEAKMIILQTYVVAFGAGWGFWLGSSNSSRKKDELLGGLGATEKTSPTSSMPP